MTLQIRPESPEDKDVPSFSLKDIFQVIHRLDMMFTGDVISPKQEAKQFTAQYLNEPNTIDGTCERVND